jgi:hypothetical protein
VLVNDRDSVLLAKEDEIAMLASRLEDLKKDLQVFLVKFRPQYCPSSQ